MKTDSLIREWNTSKDDTHRVSICVKFAGALGNNDPKRAYLYLDTAMMLAQKHKFTRGIGDVYNVLGLTVFKQGRYSDAMTYYFLSYDVRRSLNDERGQAGVLNNIGRVHEATEDFKKARECYDQALAINTRIGNKKWIATNYINIGVLFGKQKQLDSSIAYQLKAYRIAREIKDMRNVAFCSSNLGVAYLEKMEYAEAMYYFEEALKLRKQDDDNSLVSQTLNNMARAQMGQKKYTQALKQAEEAYQLALQADSYEGKESALSTMAEAAEKSGDYKTALGYFRMYKLLSDSAQKQQNLVKVQELQAKYNEKQTKGQLNDLSKLHKQDEEKLEEHKTIIFYIIIGLLVVVLLAAFMFFRFRIKSKANQQLNSYFKDLTTIDAIGKKITSSKSIEEINNTVYAEINKLMDAAGFGIGVISKDGHSISFPGYIENGKKLNTPYYDMNDVNRLTVYCAVNRKEIFIGDMQRDVRKYIKVYQAPVSGASCDSIMYIPLVSNDRVLGVITVQSFRKDAYTDYHFNLLKNISSHTAIAIDNAQMYKGMEDVIEQRTHEVVLQKEELEKSFENTRLLSEIGQQITSTLNFERIFNRLYQSVNELMPAEIFAVRLYHPEKNAVEYKFEMENGVQAEEPMWVSMDDVDNYSVWCVRNRKEIFINDNLNEYKKYVNQIRVVAGDMPHSLIFYPLVAGEKVIGVISIQSFRKNAYKPVHISILKTLASYTAIAMQNADFYGMLEDKVKMRTEELIKIKNIVEEKNKDITDSIRYAKKIQTALLPGMEKIKSGLKNFFIFFQPRDIVSGDFYFYTAVGDKAIFAVADCTGHGVPGAIISAICIELMYQVLGERNFTTTGAALTEIDIKLRTLLKQDQGDQSNDGMDCALCMLDTRTNELMFSGAHRPLLLLNEGLLSEYKSASQSIGGDDLGTKTFETHAISLKPGNRLYMFTDGLVDQFGGPKGKKFKIKKVQEIILAGAQERIEEQRDTFHSELIIWKQNYAQVDDILLMGVEV